MVTSAHVHLFVCNTDLQLAIEVFETMNVCVNYSLCLKEDRYKKLQWI